MLANSAGSWTEQVEGAAHACSSGLEGRGCSTDSHWETFSERERGLRIIPTSEGDWHKKKKFSKALVYIWHQRWLSSGQGTNVFLT